jgi:Na+-transporting NADH:ubiquinone oxidoreductase subunit NqrB
MEVWAYSIAPFIYARPFEQIRNDVAFHNLPVRLIGNGGGYAYGVMGPTHHAIEDYGVLLTLPNIMVYVPVFDEDVDAIVEELRYLREVNRPGNEFTGYGALDANYRRDLINVLQKALYGLLQLLPLIVVVHIVGLGIEFIFAASRGHQVEEGFLVSGMLIPLVCPPDMPLWMVALATAFAVIIAKEAFGGTGMNILNVALTARVFLFFAYPTYISGDTCWVSYDYNWLHQIFSGFLHANENLALVDGYSGATPLALAAQGGWSAVTAKYSFSDILYGFHSSFSSSSE